MMSSWRPTAASLLVGIVACLITIGVVILYSTSGMPGLTDGPDPTAYLKRQALWILLGAAAFMVTSRLDYRLWRRLAVPIAVVTLIMLAMVITPGIGTRVSGSSRWLQMGPIRFQPSELAKLASVMLLAWWMTRIQRNPQEFKRGLVIPCALIGLFGVLIILEPDFGTTMLIGAVGMAIMFVGGTRPSYLFLACLGSVSALGLLIAHNPERMGRIIAFLNPPKYARDEAYQLLQALYAFVAGGLHGVGLGNSIQKREYLPEAHTDFIYAILGEELGLWGSMGVLLLFLGLFACGMRIASVVDDRFGKLMAFGITLAITMQAGLNIGVVTGSLPTKGITLPFISFGGSSMMVSLAMVGILVNIALTAPARPHVLEREERRERLPPD
jgi:cell division protein FtsW